MTTKKGWLHPKAEIIFCYLPSCPERVVHVLTFLKMSRVIFVCILNATQETEEALFPELYADLGYVLTISVAFGENMITGLLSLLSLLANKVV